MSRFVVVLMLLISLFLDMQKINGIWERDLIEGVIRGDQTAFEILFRFYYPGLTVYARQFIPDAVMAEEIVQDFFVRFWDKHQSIRPAESIKSYFFSSIKNSSLNVLKHQKIEEKYVRKMTEMAEDNLLYDPNLYIASELQEKIKNTIELLPERCREIFLMSRIKGFSNDEIAKQLDISKRTVETQISNALKILRTELKDYVGLLLLLGIGNY